MLLKFAELFTVLSLTGNISSAPSKKFELQNQMVGPVIDEKVI
jgi:hypothetical protein